ncbi:hypothetical protein WN48_02627 [Eufriesea mexicana]|uniref:Uncharacterized protein n=1 Tax=Eufriesea mexicana TaxID=516756 RepID=A0A310SKU5_9HYME|nr:hypothetical protein WN48_02627 [Eufriesea mexicana]
MLRKKNANESDETGQGATQWGNSEWNGERIFTGQWAQFCNDTLALINDNTTKTEARQTCRPSCWLTIFFLTLSRRRWKNVSTLSEGK